MNGNDPEKKSRPNLVEVVGIGVPALATLVYGAIKVAEWLDQWWNSPGGVAIRSMAVIGVVNAISTGEQILNNIGIR